MKNPIESILSVLMRQVTEIGSAVMYAIICLFLLIVGNIHLFYVLLASFIVIEAVSIGMKILFFKERPNKQKYENLIERIDASSFPSVHSARAFAFAIIMSWEMQNIFLTWMFTILALLVSYSRIYLKKHYAIDVVAGIVIGSTIAALTLYLF